MSVFLLLPIFCSGAYLGGAIGPWPLVSYGAITWAEGLSTKTVGEDLFFWPSRNFGPKTGLNLSGDLFLF